MQVFVKKFADVSKFALWADGPVEGKKARFVLSFRDGNPRLTVYTGVTGKEGVISFPSDIPTIVYFLNTLKEIADGPAGNKVIIDSLTTVYENDKPTNNKKVISSLYVGKSNEGIVYLAILTENRPKIVFEIKPSPFHIFKDKDGNKVDDVIVSSKIAKGLADFMLNVISDAIMRYSMEELEGGGADTSSQQQFANKAAAGIIPNVDVLEDVPY